MKMKVFIPRGAVLTTGRNLFPKQRNVLSAEDMTSLATDTCVPCLIVVGAFDGEGYVIWR